MKIAAATIFIYAYAIIEDTALKMLFSSVLFTFFCILSVC